MEPNKPKKQAASSGNQPAPRPPRTQRIVSQPAAQNQPAGKPAQPQAGNQPARPRPAQQKQQQQQQQQPKSSSGQAKSGNAGQAKPNGGGQNRSGGNGKGRGGGNRYGGNRRPTPAQASLNAPVGGQAPAVPVNKSIYNGVGGEQVVKNTKRQANTVTREPKLKVIPMGGLGEVGKNMMAIEYENDIVVVDMGFMFPTEEHPGVDYIIPDVTYLEKNKHKIRGHVLTHAHEDHMGGIPFILPKLPAPIYTARFSAGMVEKKLVEYHLKTQPQIRVLDPDKHEKVRLGAFTIELVRVTHSIPDACAVVISTPLGNVVHTGDWRFDPSPVDNKPADVSRLKQIGDEGVLLLMSDSTSCEFPGRSQSEQAILESFIELFKRQNGRIIMATFASQVNRVQLIVDAAQKTGRKLAFTGRSMLANVELAVKLGYLRVPAGMIMKVQDITRQPDNKVVILCTGSQGEVNSALTRMSTGDHPHVKIKAGDAVIMSSSVIPGNEKSVVGSIDSLMREGSKVYHNKFREIDDCGILHVGGHAQRDELTEMIDILRPKYFMPEHGEFHMLVRHAELAVRHGMPQENVFVLDNGDVLEITAKTARKGERVHSGAIMVDGSGIGDVEGIVLRDRRAMSEEGIFVIVAQVDKRTGKLVGSPDIISRGFVYMKGNEELIARARSEVRKSFERRNTKEPADWNKFKLKLRDDISQFLYDRTKRNPMILPVINEV